MTRVAFDNQRGRELLAMMERIRAFEEQACLAAERDKLVLGAIHPSIGQEAVAAGIMCNLNRDDVLLSNHRGHGHTLAKGAASLAMMRELLGRKGGCCGGKGGSMPYRGLQCRYARRERHCGSQYHHRRRRRVRS